MTGTVIRGRLLELADQIQSRAKTRKAQAIAWRRRSDAR